MGWWGTKPWESDQFGDWWYDVSAESNLAVEKILHGAMKERHPEYSDIYAACGLVVRLGEGQMHVDKDLVRDAIDAIELVAHHVNEMGWKDVAAARRDIRATRARLERLLEGQVVRRGRGRAL